MEVYIYIYVYPTFNVYSKICLQTKSTNGHAPEPEQIEEALEALEITTTELPPPHPPSCRKKDIYTDVSVFNELDEQVIKVSFVFQTIDKIGFYYN